MKPGSHHTPEARERCGSGRRGKTTTEEQRRKISDTMRRRLADPEVRARHGQAAALACLTPSQRSDYDLLRSYGYTRAEAFAALGVPLAAARERGIDPTTAASWSRR